MEISLSEKAIARHLEEVFRARPRVFVHRESESDPFYMAIARVDNYPETGMVTMSTIGVSNSPLYQEDGSIYEDTRIEFIASCRFGQEDDLRESLLLAASYVTKIKGFACPGMFLNNLFGTFRPTSSVPHGFLTTPFVYDRLDKSNNFVGRIVSWLQVMPVSSDEITFAQEQSIDALETLFEEKDVLWDYLDRYSVV